MDRMTRSYGEKDAYRKFVPKSPRIKSTGQYEALKTLFLRVCQETGVGAAILRTVPKKRAAPVNIVLPPSRQLEEAEVADGQLGMQASGDYEGQPEVKRRKRCF